MPRYEPYKSRYKGNYTRQIKNESKEINLKKPLIISVVFIIFAAVIFSIIKNYSPVVDIAIKDFLALIIEKLWLWKAMELKKIPIN